MSAPSAAIPVVILGGSGYVAGELLRLLLGHPALTVAEVLSESQRGEPVATVFPWLGESTPRLAFGSFEDLAALAATSPRLAIFSAAAHGASAALVDRALAIVEAAGCEAHVVDLSADFRYPTAAAYEAVYAHPHGAPSRLGSFASALPEHLAGTPTPHVGHPGCFTSAVTLATVPLVATGLVEPHFFVSAVTGSTGAGRTPTPTTHHPERRSTLFAYGALAHRHEPEMRRLVQAATGVEPTIDFVPHAGPFARGIHATISARLVQPTSSAEVRAAVASFYAGASLVTVREAPPKLQHVVGSCRAELAFAVREGTLVAFSVLDNLAKGAAGGGLQWMNRLFALPETLGLLQPGLGWL